MEYGYVRRRERKREKRVGGHVRGSLTQSGDLASRPNGMSLFHLTLHQPLLKCRARHRIVTQSAQKNTKEKLWQLANFSSTPPLYAVYIHIRTQPHASMAAYTCSSTWRSVSAGELRLLIK